MQNKIKEIIQDSISTKQRTINLSDKIKESANIMINALKNNNKILVCGNGGSAADAQHMAGEMVVRFEKERVGLPCVNLTTDSTVLTACSNDYNFDCVFSRQVEALGKEGDVLVGISTSGNSVNVIKAFEEANKKGLKCIALTGKDGGKINQIRDILNIIITSNITARIQESHITIIHIWCKLIEDELFE